MLPANSLTRVCGTRTARPSAARVPPLRAASTIVLPEQRGKPTPLAAGQPPRGYQDALMLQGFAWDSCFQHQWYNVMRTKIDVIKAAGVTHVWLPPPSQSVSPQGYMPGQLYNLQSKYGSKEQLLTLLQALKREGLRPVADVVINHRCADEMDSSGTYNRYRDDVDHRGRKVDWGQWAITGNDPLFHGTGNPDTGDDYGPAPDLDHASPELRAALVDWLQWLQSLGFDGWRFDFSRGYAAAFTAEYVDASTGADALNVGEYWVDLRWAGPDLERNQDEARQRMVGWIKGAGERCCAFDFPTKGILQEAVKHTQYDRLRDEKGRAPGLIGLWPGKAVTFIENHDTGSTQNHWPFPACHVSLGYAYILTHPGVPCVFGDHLLAWGDDLRGAIGDLAALRCRVGVRADSPLTILAAHHDMYVARVAGAGGASLTVKLGPRYDMGDLLPQARDGWKMALSGKDWAVWERSA